MSSLSTTITRVGVGAALAACVAIALPAAMASAQIGPARRIEGSPVANEAVRARFAWGASGGRIVWVNTANEVFYHRLSGNQSVTRHIRMRGHTVGVRGDETEFVLPWSGNDILVVTQAGLVHRHTIRGESIGPPVQIPGAPVGTNGQDPVFMFRVQNRLVNVTQQGEIWVHQVGQTIMPPQRIGVVGTGAALQVRYAFNLGRTIYVVTDQGAVIGHDIVPSFGRGRVIRNANAELARQDYTRFIFVLGNGLYQTTVRGELFVHDISQLVQASGGNSATLTRNPTPPGAAPAPTPAPAPAAQ